MSNSFQEFLPLEENKQDRTRVSFDSDPRKVSIEKFELPHSYWESINSDPVLREGLEKVVQHRVQEFLEGRYQQERVAVMQEARDLGFKKGLADAKDEIDRVKENIEVLCREILSSKEKILEEHEEIWARAFEHLLKRFMIGSRVDIGQYLRGWLREAIGDYSEKHRVIVKLSEVEFSLVKQWIGSSKGKAYEFVADPALKEGELYCQSDDGGIFFSPGEATERLHAWIEEHFPKPNHG